MLVAKYTAPSSITAVASKPILPMASEDDAWSQCATIGSNTPTRRAGVEIKTSAPLPNVDPPPRASIGIARVMLVQDGPLPEGWYLELGQGEFDVAFRQKGDPKRYRDHPLQEFYGYKGEMRNDYTPHELPGWIHPDQYTHGEWQWSYASSHVSAVQISANDYRVDVSGRMIGMCDVDNHISQLASPRPHSQRIPLYHPGNRAGDPLLPDESRASELAASLGHSLVIVHCQAGCTLNYEPKDPGTYQTPIVKTRFSINGQSERMPPLYVGFFLGQWFGLRKKGGSYREWDPAR